MFGLGTPELLILLFLALLLFGGAKLPQMMKGMGEGMKEFKKATRDDDETPLKNSTTVNTNPNDRTQV